MHCMGQRRRQRLERDEVRPGRADPDAAGQPCAVEGSGVSGIDSCELGSMCFFVDPETNEGTCVALCVGTPELPSCGSPTEVCTTSNDGVLNLCLLSCDPKAPNCPAGQECLDLEQGHVCGPS